MPLPSTSEEPFALPIPEKPGYQARLMSLLIRTLEGVSRLRQLNDMYHACTGGPDASFFSDALKTLQVTVAVAPDELARIPQDGPCIVTANHPFGMIEGIMLGELLATAHPHFKFLGNYLLDRMPELRRYNIAVDPFGGKGAVQRNIAPLRESLRLLKEGGALAIFPAGEVAHLQLGRRGVADPPWNPNIAGLIRRSAAPVVPVFFEGSNSLLFHLLGLLHPRLRTLMLPNELLNKQRKALQVRIGTPIPAERLAAIPSDEELIAYLRMRTYLLGGRKLAPAQKPHIFSIPAPAPAQREPVAEPEPVDWLQRDIAGLNDSHLLAESGDFQVFIATAQEVPHILFEIGRRREIAFRGAGEGTGKRVDLDKFDTYYHHLFLWNRAQQQVAGAYRIGCADEILARFGPRGLYTHTLFRYKAEMLRTLGPALELGRAFINPDYQRSYAPLLLLWKGIGQFVTRHPHYRHLFGPVSISADYSPMSRQLMVAFLQANHLFPEMARLVKARQPMRLVNFRDLQPRHCAAQLSDLDELASLVNEVEHVHKGIPILLRQYLKLGGRLLDFNIDAEFGNAIDGLIVVDLLKTDARLLEKYFGKAGLASFYAHHHLAMPVAECVA